MKDVDWTKWNSKTDNFRRYSKIESELIYGKRSMVVGSVVSVVILTYKRADGLAKAVQSALSQNYDGKFCVVVLDDSGFDQATDTLMKDLCNKHRNLLYYRNKRNLGQYANWNRACEISPTDWYCLLHDDDMLQPDYLTEVMRCTKESDLGLIGVYIEVNDTRKGSDSSNVSRGLFYEIQNLFMKLRKGKMIRLTLKNNINHIYVMNSTFINRSKAMSIGGLDDNYFPSSDFAFAAKMNYYFTTGFLSLRLTKKGIGESESLKLSVCNDSIRCAYYQTEAMCKSFGYSSRAQKRRASFAAVVSEIGVKGYNDVDYGEIKAELGMPRYYNHSVIINLINIISKLQWALLLFQR